MLQAIWEFFPNVVGNVFGLEYIILNPPIPEALTLLSMVVLSVRAGEEISKSLLGRIIRKTAIMYWQYVCLPVITVFFRIPDFEEKRRKKLKKKIFKLCWGALCFFMMFALILPITILIFPYILPFPLVFQAVLSEYMQYYATIYEVALYDEPFSIAFVLLLILGAIVHVISSNLKFKAPASGRDYERKLLYILDNLSTTYFTIPTVIILYTGLIILFSSGLEMTIAGADWIIDNSKAN
ncbi:MAG: hypothetical protein AAFX54_18395 [Pseudomonadota bacterium]